MTVARTTLNVCGRYKNDNKHGPASQGKRKHESNVGGKRQTQAQRHRWRIKHQTQVKHHWSEVKYHTKVKHQTWTVTGSCSNVKQGAHISGQTTNTSPTSQVTDQTSTHVKHHTQVKHQTRTVTGHWSNVKHGSNLTDQYANVKHDVFSSTEAKVGRRADGASKQRLQFRARLCSSCILRVSSFDERAAVWQAQTRSQVVNIKNTRGLASK